MHSVIIHADARAHVQMQTRSSRRRMHLIRAHSSTAWLLRLVDDIIAHILSYLGTRDLGLGVGISCKKIMSICGLPGLSNVTVAEALLPWDKGPWSWWRNLV